MNPRNSNLQSLQALSVNTEVELKKAINAFLAVRQLKDVPTVKLYDINNENGEALPLYKAYGKTIFNGGIEIFEEGKLYMAYPPHLDNTPFKPNINIKGDTVTMTVWYCSHNCLILSDDLSDSELEEFYQEYPYYADDRNGYDEYCEWEVKEAIHSNFLFIPVEADLYIAPLNSDEIYSEKYERMYVLYSQMYDLQNKIDELSMPHTTDLVVNEDFCETFSDVEVETLVGLSTAYYEA